MSSGQPPPLAGPPPVPPGPLPGPPAVPPEPPRRGRMAVAIAAAVALVAAAAGAAWWALAGGGRAEAREPAEAVRRFYAAVAGGDCEEAGRFVAGSFITREEICADVASVREEVGTFEGIRSSRSLDDDTSHVVVERTVRGVTDARILTVERRGGALVISAGAACYDVEHPEDLGGNHLGPGETFDGYSSDPPTSGPHADRATQAGVVYSEPQPVAEVIHAMEHGAVVFWTDGLPPDLAAVARDAVEDAFDVGYAALIVNPHPGMDVPFAMTAWGTLQRCEGIDPAAVGSFVEEFYASGLEGRLACTGSAQTLPPCREG